MLLQRVAASTDDRASDRVLINIGYIDIVIVLLRPTEGFPSSYCNYQVSRRRYSSIWGPLTRLRAIPYTYLLLISIIVLGEIDNLAIVKI